MIGFTRPERYLMERTLRGVIVLGAASLALIISIDFLEALRQVGGRPGAGLLEAVQLTLLRGPQLLMILSPFIMLFGTLLAFAQLARSLEIAVFRAAGLSVWRIVGAAVTLAALIGFGLVTLVDPLTTRMSLRADNLLASLKGSETSAPRAFQNGVWLRQDNDDGTVFLIHADSLDIGEGSFDNVRVWKKTSEGLLQERYDAPIAELEGPTITLVNAQKSVPGGVLTEPVGNVTIATAFQVEDLAMSGTRPESLNIWNLPRLMQRIGKAGIPLEPYSLRLHELFATPLRLAAMAVIACVFALPIHARGGGTARLILSGIVAGFAAFILIQFSTAMGEAGLIPVVIAAWTPPMVTMLIGLSVLLFREDG
ncbi:MAG: LptF/LptG family permease [Pseudomonadota bacterium]